MLIPVGVEFQAMLALNQHDLSFLIRYASDLRASQLKPATPFGRQRFRAIRRHTKQQLKIFSVV